MSVAGAREDPGPLKDPGARPMSRPTMRPALHAAVAVAALATAGCDLAGLPTLADDLGRPAVIAGVTVQTDGLTPKWSAIEIAIDSLAIRRQRDQTWLPLVVESTAVIARDERPVVLTEVPVGADHYDRVEIIAAHVLVQGHDGWRIALLDTDAATLAVQWAFDRHVQPRIVFDVREDLDVEDGAVHLRFAPLVALD